MCQNVVVSSQPSAWTVYLASDDADATVKAIGEAGGAVLVPPMEIPGNGRMMIAQDPAGAVFGVWEARGMVGIAVYNEPGGLLWEDARLSDPDAGRAFYSSVFGHRYEPVEGALLAVPHAPERVAEAVAARHAATFDERRGYHERAGARWRLAGPDVVFPDGAKRSGG